MCIRDSYTVIDSVYNASVDSMRAALKVLNRYENRKVAVLGDMFEMGSFAEAGHRQVGKDASENADEMCIRDRLNSILNHTIEKYHVQKISWMNKWDIISIYQIHRNYNVFVYVFFIKISL